MHSHRRARWKIFFEVLCALGLGASFAAAWDQTGTSAFLASASIMALVAIYWSFGLFGRVRAEPVAAVAEVRETEETAVREHVFASEPEVETSVRMEVFPFQPDAPPESEPVATAPKKKRARKAKKAALDAVPVVKQPEPPAFGEPVSHGPPLEQLFEPQPFARQPRAFGRKARGPRTLSVG